MVGKNTCNKCGTRCMDTLCWKCKRKELCQHKVIIPCARCTTPTEVPTTKVNQYKTGYYPGPFCSLCRSAMSRLRMKNTRAKQTPEQRVEHARLARAQVKADTSATVHKQWATIKANPELYAKAKARLLNNAKNFWSTATEDKKNYVITQLAKSQPRSSLSNKLKSMMVTAGVYDGFVSEEAFHGFIPDEINHHLKLIVEFYGDVYHCNPKKYTNPSLYVSAIQRTVQEQWNRDRRRLGVFYRYGYLVIIVWESDFNADSDAQIERIKHAIALRKNAPKE